MKTRQESASGRISLPLLWLQGLACGALLAFATPSFILLGAFLSPALACLAADSEPARRMSRAVALACLAGALPPTWSLWMHDDRMEVALALLTDPATLFFGWGPAAGVWALCEILPVVLKSLWDMSEAARSRSLEAELKALKAEWDVG